MIKKTLTLSIACALSTISFASHAQYSSSIFFGDSLSDSGYFKPVVKALTGADSASFTTNPGNVWAVNLANTLGTSANPSGNGQVGTNYAAGGAQVSTEAATQLGQAPSVKTQISHYLSATEAKADPNALYSVWGGANDFLVQLSNPASINIATLQSSIAPTAAAEAANIIGLQAAGARYILVPNLPDMGLTPAINQLVQATGNNDLKIGATAIADGYNKALYGILQQQNAQIIPIDTFHLLQEIVASPAQYGFSNTSSTACLNDSSVLCQPSAYANPTADQSYVFADSVHPTTRTHEILAQYAASLLSAPAQVLALSATAIDAGISDFDQVNRRLQFERGTKPGTELWLDGATNNSGMGGADGFYKSKSFSPRLAIGADYHEQNWTYGGYLKAAQNNGTWNHAGSYNVKQSGIGLYANWQNNAPWLNMQINYNRLNANTNRSITLGQDTRNQNGSAAGTLLGLGLKGGWDLNVGAIKTGPTLGLNYVKAKFSAFSENNPTQSTSLAYPSQSQSAFIGSIGWNAKYAVNNSTNLYGEVNFNHNFTKSDSLAGAKLQSVNYDMYYYVPASQSKRNNVSLLLGANKSWDNTRLSAGLNASFASKQNNLGAFIGLSHAF